MINDIKVVMWKEWNEFFFQQSIKSKFNVVFAIALIGIIMPLKNGSGWFDTSFFYSVALTGPLLMMTTVICDLFVGERERHTLETLLASRLSDKGIVLGKILFAMSYAMCISLLMIILNVISVNVAFYKGVFLVFSAKSILLIVIINFLLGMFGSLIGAIICIRVSTVKQAQLILTVSIIFLIFAITFLLTNYLPGDVKALLLKAYQSLGTNLSIVVISLLFLTINILILQYIFVRYNRIRIFS